MIRERNILLTIEYDGSGFFGWQKQPSVRTVQGELERVLSAVCGSEVKLNGTSRTDAGVHALGQRASFKGEYGIPADRLMLASNNILSGARNGSGAGEIRIVSAKDMPLDFHARFDSKGKKYRYVISNNREMDIFRRRYCYQINRPLDIQAMAEAASYVIGTHDFACFQSAGGQERETTVRTVYDLQIKKNNDDILIEISGDGFLYNMVRIITGTLVEIGLGKRKASQMKDIIDSASRKSAGHRAPAEGLYLVEVYYEQEI